MPDIINVSDSVDRLNAKTRARSETVTVDDSVSILVIHNRVRTLDEDVTISDDTATLRTKARAITQTTTIEEQIQLFKNGVEITPETPPVVEIPGNLIGGTRERRIRIPRPRPRAIIIDEVKNVAKAPLKLLARLDNKAIVGIRPRLTQNVVRSSLATEKPVIISRAYSAIKTSLQPIPVKAKVALLSSPIHVGKCQLKIRPHQGQTIESLKAVNFDKMYRLNRLMKIVLLAENI